MSHFIKVIALLLSCILVGGYLCACGAVEEITSTLASTLGTTAPNEGPSTDDPSSEDVKKYDVVVYGDTPAAVSPQLPPAARAQTLRSWRLTSSWAV